jgi:cardiolipin synthase
MRHIPNILTVFRLLLVPVFPLLYFFVSPVAALPLLLLTGTSDVLDGYLARKNGWGSVFGKVLDPIADKLMQGAMLFSLLFDGLVLWYLALPLVLKELTQGVLSIAMLRQRRVHTDSRWYGKAALCLFYVSVVASVLLACLASRAVAEAVSLALWLMTVLVMM